MSAYSPRSTGEHGRPGAPDRAGALGLLDARPVPSAPNRRDTGRQAQSDADFATVERCIAAAQALNRRSDRILTRIQIAIAATGVIWVGVPALCMWLAGGTPA